MPADSLMGNSKNQPVKIAVPLCYEGNKVRVAIDGLAHGTYTRKHVIKWFAPSIIAASSSSFGIPRKKLIISTML